MGKDPNKPRGRTTAYAFFVMDEKETYQKVREDGKRDRKWRAAQWREWAETDLRPAPNRYLRPLMPRANSDTPFRL